MGTLGAPGGLLALPVFPSLYPRTSRVRSEWIDQAAAHPEQAGDREIALKRIDMVAAHDALEQLSTIRRPTLVTCGDHNFCTPLALSEEIARAIPGAELVVFSEGGELIEHEQEEKYFLTVSRFIDRNTSATSN